MTTSSTVSLSVGSPNSPQARVTSKSVRLTSGMSPVMMALNRAAALVNSACCASVIPGPKNLTSM